MNINSKIYVAGHKGLVGSALVRELENNGYLNIAKRTHDDLDLTNQSDVNNFFKEEKPEFVFLAAAKVGGIYANTSYPAEFIFSNLAIQTNIIHQSYLSGVKRLLFLGSSCIYPRDCMQPIKEEYLLTGPLENTNKPYALAKIAGMEMCQSYNRQYKTKYLTVMPTNLYGPGDNYDLENSHVIPGLIRKFHEAKVNKIDKVFLWGTGKPKREFLHVDDLAKACFFLMSLEDSLFDSYVNPINEDHNVPFFNVGSGEELTIEDLAKLIKLIIGFDGKIIFDSTKPNGTMKKLLDSRRINELGWKPYIKIKEGLQLVYRDLIANNNLFIEK